MIGRKSITRFPVTIEGFTEEQLEVYEDLRGEFWKFMKDNNVDLYAAE